MAFLSTKITTVSVNHLGYVRSNVYTLANGVESPHSLECLRKAGMRDLGLHSCTTLTFGGSVSPPIWVKADSTHLCHHSHWQMGLANQGRTVPRGRALAGAGLHLTDFRVSSDLFSKG